MPPWCEDQPWTVVERRRRGGRERRTPSRRCSDRETDASVAGEQRYGDERDFPPRRQRKWSREPRVAERYAAQERTRPEQNRKAEWDFTQNKRYVKPARMKRAEPPQKKIQSDDPDFSAKVRIIHRLIKSVHHLKNVSQDIYPPSLNKIVHNLMTVIQPAIPQRETQNLVEGNAKNWAHTTIVILRDHYNQCIEEELKTLFEFPKQDWRGPLEVATSWAKRNLGRRLQPESWEQAQTLIVSKLTVLQAAAGSTNAVSEPEQQPQEVPCSSTWITCAYGPGLIHGTVNKPAVFTVNTKDAGDGGLSFVSGH
ncbi:uncharacterized protein LOC134632932 isoform X2 [Pelmatolapia mariae]|uniref:uncharacterized protein LOC134632932 isoform X2 n=1 Tax=Pelmatolapia mariae TaxID=158779 RepID=UPI002FE59972